MLTRPIVAFPRYSGATAKVAMSHVRARSMSIPVRAAIAPMVSPHTGRVSSSVLNPSSDGSNTRMVPAGRCRRWSTTQRKMLASS